MDPDSIPWDDLKVLLAVEETGSFLAAGKRLGLSTSTVARRVELLEAQLKRTLVRRTSEGTATEPVAEGLLAVARTVRAELAAAMRHLADGSASFAGTVRVSLGAGFVPVVTGAIAEFRRQHPETGFELVVEDRPANLTRREADLGLRTSQSVSDGTVLRRIGPLRYAFYASDDYLGRRGDFRTTPLAEHEFVDYEGDLARQPVMGWLRDQGAALFPVAASTSAALIAAVQAGQGIALLPVVVAADHAGLRRLEGATPPEKSVYLALHRDVRRVVRVRAFADLLVERIASLLRGFDG